MKIRRTNIVAILKQTSLITTSRAGVDRWCVECDAPMAMMSPELAATFCLQTVRAIYRLIEAGAVHFTEGPEGVMVCPASLMKNDIGQKLPSLLNP